MASSFPAICLVRAVSVCLRSVPSGTSTGATWHIYEHQAMSRPFKTFVILFVADRKVLGPSEEMKDGREKRQSYCEAGLGVCYLSVHLLLHPGRMEMGF